MRSKQANLLLALTVFVVLAVIVLAWRPWQTGAQGRIATSGLVPVLSLLLGQLVTLAVSASATEQSLLLRRLELDHDADEARLAEQRQARLAEEERQGAKAADIRERFVAALRSSAALAPALGEIIANSRVYQVPQDEFIEARIALLRLLPLLASEDIILAKSVRDALAGLSELVAAATNDSRFFEVAETCIKELDEVQREIAQSEHVA